MATFQTAVERSLERVDGELESLIVTPEAMALSYRVPDADEGDGLADSVAAVAAAYLLAVRDGAGRPELTAHLYVGDSPAPTASYCVDADWARACVLGDIDHREYLQRTIDTLASRQQRAAGKVSIADA
ncbi:MAG: hypothetical protein ABEJ31_12875 [Haloarculaceae archaeon]